MAEPVRHRDTGKSLPSFAERIDATCPRCGHAGVVRTEGADRRRNAAFAGPCRRLDVRSERDDRLGRVRPIGERTGGYCGRPWRSVSQIRPSAGTIPLRLDRVRSTACNDAIAASCPIGKRTRDIAVQAHRAPADESHDPHFGLPRRLIERARAGLPWAYNNEHIDAFRGYVAADQREPRSPILNRTMTPRLPSWKTLARHRTMLLKSPDRLAATLDDPRAA